jgi:hypothetical protein
MKLLIAVLGVTGLVAMGFVFLILARLTQKWEVVTKVKSHYHMFYVAAALAGIASVVRLLRIGYLDANAGPPFLLEPQSWFYFCFYYVPLAIGITISLGVTWKSWGWLLGEPSD